MYDVIGSVGFVPNEWITAQAIFTRFPVLFQICLVYDVVGSVGFVPKEWVIVVAIFLAPIC